MKLRFWIGLMLSSLIWFSLTNRAGAITYTLTVAAQGSGTVDRNPANANYPSGVNVTVTATPSAGWYFSNWSGDTNGSVNPLNVLMTANLNITGNFLAYPTYPLTLTTNGQGSIVLNPANTIYQSNTVVTATATPATGWVFTGWTGSAAGATNPLVFTMNTANSLTGNFAQVPAFDVQPVGVTNSPGSAISFFAHSVGNAPVAYQWYFNNGLLPGATNTTLPFTNVQFTSAGSYQVIATNLYGSATSSVALLVLTNGFSNPVSVCDEPSLRAAIAAGGWIQFGCNGTITLSNPITINNDVILDGSLVKATISGGGKVRVFNVSNGKNLTITNLTLANGMTNNSTAAFVDAGAIYNDGGNLNLIGCQLLNNAAYATLSATARGGAIFSKGGTVMLSGTVVSNNLAYGTENSPSVGVSEGGAIYMTNGSLTLINCLLTTNTCQSYDDSYGGAICVAGATVVFSNCQFNANNVVCQVNTVYEPLFEGGAVAMLGGNLIVQQCQFLNNGIRDQGNVYVEGSRGGALFSAGTATIQDSSFLNNQIAEAALRGNGKLNAQGGAIYNSSDLTLTGCCIASNLVWGLDGSSTQGGISQAGDGLGGGIYNAGQLKMTNCTIAWNTAHGGKCYGPPLFAPSGPNGNAIGAGLYNESNSTSLLMNVTLANNISVTTNQYTATGVAAGDQIGNTNGTVSLHNCLLAYAGANGNVYGPIVNTGYNISSDASAAFVGNSSYNSTDPQLGALTNNGGLTLTMSPLASSPAIDTGDSSGAPGTDQRGLVRPYGAGYDIGAVEYGSTTLPNAPFTLTVVAQGSGTVARNPSLVSYPSGVTVTVTATPSVGWYFSNWSGDTNGSVNPLSVTITTNLSITGNFLPYPTYPLTLTTNGQGNIVLNPANTTYYSNTVVTATATPAAGWVFTGWTGSASGTTNPLVFTMNTANSLAGNFAQLPAFDVQPVGVTNSLGSTVSFFVHSLGTAPVAYQWYFNNGLLPGATNTTLFLTNVMLSQAGSYTVTATNSYGSATSSVALLVLTNGSSNPVNVCDEPSLRAAIAKGGWISFGCNGTITLTGTLAISNNVILDASSVSATISGGNAVRLFKVAAGASLTITNLMLANGISTNVYNNTLINPFEAEGGAIYNDGGTVNLVGCTLTNNSVVNYNYVYSSSFLNDSGSFSCGGAIFNNGGSVSLSGCSLSNNLAIYSFTGTGRGGAIFSTNGSLSLAGCILTGNQCASLQKYAAAGGAVCIVSGSACVTNCIFSNNSALGTHSSPGNFDSDAIPGTGGAIALLGGNLTVLQCQFNKNAAQGGLLNGYAGPGEGGAIYCAATMDVRSCSFAQNTAFIGSTAKLISKDGQGGAIYNLGTITLNSCCLYSNLVSGSQSVQAQGGTSEPGNGFGGGIFNAGLLKATNCTLALNKAQAGLGLFTGFNAGPNGTAIGGGIYNISNATAMLMNVTLASNLCVTALNGTNGSSAGDQIGNLSGGIVSLHNTLLAYAGTNGNVYGSISNAGYNMCSDASAAFGGPGNTSYNNTDPQLASLADNGGPTLTMSPLASSPAIDTGDSAGAPRSDQRGLLRPFGSGYDVGAVEYGSIYAAPAAVQLSFTRSAPNLILNFTATPTCIYHLQWSTNLTSWNDMETIGAFNSPSNITRSMSPQGTAGKYFRVWYQ